MIKVAAIQTSYTENLKSNVEKTVAYVRKAAQQGAQIILPSELFEGIYFPKTEKDIYFDLAKPYKNHPTIEIFCSLARELKSVIPVSFFERDGSHFYNSVCVIDADGTDLGVYRKSHIPDGPGYEEKFYFRPGNTGFKVWKTKYATIGIGICWDQWFPECARSMMLQGAELLLYPTAIGSEPEAPEFNTKDLWQRAMIGHAVSNVVPVIAANRIGNEDGQIFYGHSFISSHRGEILKELKSSDEGIISAEFNLDQIKKDRASFGFFRDRRPELYRAITEL